MPCLGLLSAIHCDVARVCFCVLRVARRSIQHGVAVWVVTVGAVSFTDAQETAPPAATVEEAIATMQALVDAGFFHAAATVEGPALVEAFPDDPTLRTSYAYAAWASGDVETARSELTLATTSIDQATPDMWHLMGLLLAHDGLETEAYVAFRNAFEETQRYDHAMDWAHAAWSFGRFDEALEGYARAAATVRGRTEPWPYLNRGRIFAMTGRFDEALAAFETVVDVIESTEDPGAGLPPAAYVEAFYRMGRVRASMGDLSGAVQDYRAALSVDPNYAPAVVALDDLARNAP